MIVGFLLLLLGTAGVQDDLRGLTDSELRVGVVDTPYLEPRQVTMLAITSSAAKQDWTWRICKNQHGDARSVLVIQKRTMYEDCSGPDKPTEDAERQLNFSHTSVNWWSLIVPGVVYI